MARRSYRCARSSRARIVNSWYRTPTRAALLGLYVAGVAAGCAPPPPEEAYRRLAEDGDASAQYLVGRLYTDGGLGARDFVEAARWFRMASDQGHDAAQFSLGGLYASGQGVEQDHAEAARWYRLAAEQGHDGAQYALGSIYAAGLGVAADRVAAYTWLGLAVRSASPGDRGEYAKDRDSLEQEMTPDEITEARRLIREWRRTRRDGSP